MSETKFKRLDELRFLYGEPRTLRDADGETGWRISFLSDSRRIDHLGADGLLRALRCPKKPTMPFSAVIFDDHPAPHPWCVCGFRMPLKLTDLWKYWSHTWRIHRAAGMSWSDYHPTSDFVLIRAEALGAITGGVQDDPLDTIRAGLLKPLDAYLPPWVDSKRFELHNPKVTPKPISDLPGDPEMFAQMREPQPPPTTLQYQPLKHHVLVRTGVADVMIPRSHLQPQRVIDAVWGAVQGQNANDCLYELVDRLVIPLTDVEHPADRIGCAQGIAHALVHYAEGPNRGK